MKEWFLSREPRERVILGIGAGAAVVILLWGLVWSPLDSGVSALRASVDQNSRLLVDLQRAAALSPANAARPAQGAAQSLVVLVDSTSKQHGLAGAFTRTRPDGADGINVTLQDAPFDTLLGWIVALRSDYGIDVESASFNGSRSAGLVSGQVLLRRR
jgi:general secretion pathway protein M